MLLTAFTDYRHRIIELHDSPFSDSSLLLQPLGAEAAAREVAIWCQDHSWLADSVLQALDQISQSLGFLATTTRVISLEKGTMLIRLVDNLKNHAKY